MSVVEIGKESIAQWFSGNGTVGTTPKQLSANRQNIYKHVRVRCHSGVITIGDSALRAAAGFIISAGDLSPPIPIDDLSKVWIVGSEAGCTYSWCAA
jgi:hypothetical protein